MTEFNYSMNDLIRLFNRTDLSWEEFKFLGDYVESHERISQMIVDFVVNREMSVDEVEQLFFSPIKISAINEK